MQCSVCFPINIRVYTCTQVRTSHIYMCSSNDHYRPSYTVQYSCTVYMCFLHLYMLLYAWLKTAKPCMPQYTSSYDETANASLHGTRVGHIICNPTIITINCKYHPAAVIRENEKKMYARRRRRLHARRQRRGLGSRLASRALIQTLIRR